MAEGPVLSSVTYALTALKEVALRVALIQENDDSRRELGDNVTQLMGILESGRTLPTSVMDTLNIRMRSCVDVIRQGKSSSVDDKFVNAKDERKQLEKLRKELNEAVQVVHFSSSVKHHADVAENLVRLEKISLDPKAGVYKGSQSTQPLQLPQPTLRVFREPTRVIIKWNDPKNPPENITGYQVYDERNRVTEKLGPNEHQIMFGEPRISHGNIYTYSVSAVGGCGGPGPPSESCVLDLSYSQYPPRPSTPSIGSVQLVAGSQEDATVGAVLKVRSPPKEENVTAIIVGVFPPRRLKNSFRPASSIPVPHTIQAAAVGSRSHVQQEIFPMSVEDSPTPLDKQPGARSLEVLESGAARESEEEPQQQEKKWETISCDLNDQNCVQSTEGNLIITLPDFTKGHRYKFRVTMKSEEGSKSEPSDPLKLRARELLPGQPRDLQITDYNHNQATLSWKAPEVHPWAVESYRIQRCRGTRWEEIATTERETMTAKVENLETHSEYRFRVYSATSYVQNQLEFSNECRVVTNSHPVKRATKAAGAFIGITLASPIAVPLIQFYFARRTYEQSKESPRRHLAGAAVETVGEMTVGVLFSPILGPFYACRIAEQLYTEDDR